MLNKKTKILDVGAGFGCTSRLLAEKGGCLVTALEL